MGYHLDVAAIPLYAIAVAIAVFLAVQPTAYAASSCTPGTYSVTCINTLTFNTLFPGGGGGTFVPGQAASGIVPLTSNVISYDNANSQWLVTCPNAPNTQDELEYMVFGDGRIGGNACQASSSPLTSTATVSLTIAWSPTSTASAGASVSFANIGQLSVSNLAYSGEAYNSSKGIGSANVSSGYSSKSNVYQGVPPSSQGGIWSWNARTADFSNPVIKGLGVSDTLDLSYSISGNDANGNAYSCTYPYTFTAAAKVLSVNNANIVVPARSMPPPDNYLTFNNQTFNSITTGTQPSLPAGVTANAVAMLECYLPNFFGGWHLVGTNGIVVYNSKRYTGSCVYQYGDLPYYSTAYTPTGDPSAAQALYTPSAASSYESTYLLPALYYNSSMPVAYSSPSTQLSFVNSSYYVYSQHNLQSPGNYIDPVTLHGASSIFLNANNVLASLSSDSFYGGNNYAGSASPPGLNLQSDYVLAASATGLSDAQQVSGTSYWSGTIGNIMFVSGSANNNLFAVADLSGTYYLYRLQLVPQGELNLTGSPPDGVGTAAYPTQQAYDAAMQAYWNSVEQLQSYPIYLDSVVQLPTIVSNSKSTLGNGPPLALASDYAGDAFVVSANYTSNAGIEGGPGFVLTYISANGMVSQQWITSAPTNFNQDIQGCYYVAGGFCQNPLSMAASPTGQYLYMSDTAAPYVYIYSVSRAAPTAGASPSQYAIGATYLAAINLSYSTSQYNMSIGLYLANGGPFNSTGISNWVYDNPDTSCNVIGAPGLNYYNDSQEAPGSGCYDGNIYHIPIGLAASGSVLYVLDNWLFAPPYPATSSSSKEYSASMLMLRAFYLNGSEIPIHASTVSDVIPKTQGLSLTTGYIANKLYPPYGWPISANFSTPSGFISYCAYYCNNTPSFYLGMPTSYSNGGPEGQVTHTPYVYGGYPPIGPAVAADGPAGSKQYYVPSPLSLTSDFNNTLYLDAWSLFEPALSGSPQCKIAGIGENIGVGSNSQSAYYAACQLYTELLAIHMNVDNYTKLSNASSSPQYGCYWLGNPSGSYAGVGPYGQEACGYLNSNYLPNNGIAPTPSSYTCYIGVNKTTWGELNKGSAFSNSQSSYSYNPSYAYTSPCTFVDNLSLQRPPFIGMPDPFAYAESSGSPLNYVAIPNLASQYIPSSAGDPPDPPGLSAGQISPQNPAIASGQNVILTANPSGGTTPYTYQWYTSSSIGTCSSSDTQISGATANTYTAFPTKTTNYCYIVADSSPSTANSPTDTVTVYPKYTTSPTLSFSPSPYVTVGTNVVITATCASGDNCAIIDSNGNQLANAITIVSTSVLGCMNGGTYNSVLGYCSNGQANTVYTGSLSAGTYTFYANDLSTGTEESPGSNLYVGSQPPAPAVPTQQLIQTYLQGTAAGYVLVPYTYTYQLTYSYQGSLSSSTGPSGDCAESISGSGAPITTVYAASPVYAAPSILKEQLQGGHIIAQYQNTLNDYVANLSDQNLIIPPDINLNIFTNRILGEVFINQTVGPGGFSRYAQSQISGSPLLPLPLVFNAIHLLNYSQTVFSQYSSKYGNKPGYSAEAAIGPPLNPLTTHTNVLNAQNASWEITYNSPATLTGPVYAYSVTLQPGISLTTDGYPVVALDSMTAMPGSSVIGGYANDQGLYLGSGASLLYSYGGSGGGGAAAAAFGGNTLAPGGSEGQPGTSNALPIPVTSKVVSSLGSDIVTYLTGAGGASGSYTSAGGGGSYGVYLQADQLELSGATINTEGQAGGSGSGGGGGGVIVLAHGSSFSQPSYLYQGGAGGSGGGASGGPGNVLLFDMVPPGNVPIQLQRVNAMPVEGASCTGIGCDTIPNYYYSLGSPQPAKGQCPFSNIYCGNSIFGYSGQLGSTTALQLFSALSIYVNEIVPTLDLTYNNGLEGYNRINYTFADEFNNTINMPIDADLANVTAIGLNAQTTINDINPNETTVKVTGSAGYYPNIFTATPIPAPENSHIYIYYDTNINFYNTTNLPFPSTPPPTSHHPGSVRTQQADIAGYYKYAEECAFGFAGLCTLANPSYTANQPAGQGQLGPEEANVITFHTQYNSTGECSPEPNSLLLPTGTNTQECNIYGLFGLPTGGNTVSNAMIGLPSYPEYCIPYNLNGNGVLTSQLGLVAVVNTLKDGTFNATFNVCGTGTARVQASYYGYPPGQPQIFLQQPLSQTTLARPIHVITGGGNIFYDYYDGNVVGTYFQSSACNYGCYIASYNPLIFTSEFNYSISPNTTTVSFPIGSYLLSYGSIEALLPLIIAISAVAYLLARGLAPDRRINAPRRPHN